MSAVALIADGERRIMPSIPRERRVCRGRPGKNRSVCCGAARGLPPAGCCAIGASPITMIGAMIGRDASSGANQFS